MKSKNRLKLFVKKFETLTVVLFLLVFFVGFFMGWNFSDSSLTTSQIQIEENILDLQSFSQSILFLEIMNVSSCNDEVFSDLSDELYRTGISLEDLENQGKIDTNSYNLLKQKHNVNQVLFYSYYKTFFDKCEKSGNVVLFFFDGDKPQEASKQGEELSKLTDKYNIKILPMDYNYTKSLDYFYEFYEVQELPALVINYNTTLLGYNNFEEIEKYLN